jgi:hypothetical protein
MKERILMVGEDDAGDSPHLKRNVEGEKLYA